MRHKRTAKAVELSPIDIRIGKNIRAARVFRGLTMEQLGERLTPPVTHQQIYKYETGINRTTSSGLVGIAAALDIQFSKLVEGVDLELPAIDSVKESNLYAACKELKDQKTKDALRVLITAIVMATAAPLTKASRPRTRAID